MRVANKTLYDSIIQRLNTVSSEMMEANEVVSSAKRINNLSDDPVGLVSVLDLRSSLANVEQIERNIQVGKNWLSSGESALNQVEELMVNTKELVVQMSTATVSSTERQNAVDLVDGYLDQLISLANSQVGGRYIFGGTNTGTTPFALNAAGTQVLYSGNDIPFSIKIGKDTNIEIGRDGEDIFGQNWDDTNFFKTLIDLKTHLQNNDVTEIQATLDKLDSHLDKVRAVVSDIGGKTIRLEVKENIVQELEIAYSERKSSIEDADITEAIMILKSKELAYNAALSSSSKVMQLSLVNFL
jgi:flagellar hook-associated protein 3 FlgL